MTRTTLRTARKPRLCDSCLRWIKTGDLYLEHVASPNHEDLGNTRWRRSPECAACATRYGRAHLLVKPKPHIAGRKRNPRQRRARIVDIHLPEPTEVPA